jgi:16S rRNA (uracil1498-N3)-methyltransferase
VSIHRLFVDPAGLDGANLRLEGPDAARIYKLGLRAGDPLTVLDDSGWELDVVLDSASREACTGFVVGRRLARERRSKVSLYQALLHPSDFRRILVSATALGVVAFTPVIADGSVVPMLDASGRPEGEVEWPRLIREAAEAAGRGRQPEMRPLTLFDQALGEAGRAGLPLLCHPSGLALEKALAERPFSIELFLPPPGGFNEEELSRARARGARLVAAPVAGPDPSEQARAVLERIYGLVEEPA